MVISGMNLWEFSRAFLLQLARQISQNSSTMAQSATPISKAANSKGAAAIERTSRGVPVAQAQKRPQRDLIEAVWTMFCSIKFAVVLNIALALAAMLATIIPQMQP